MKPPCVGERGGQWRWLQTSEWRDLSSRHFELEAPSEKVHGLARGQCRFGGFPRLCAELGRGSWETWCLSRTCWGRGT